MKTYDISVEAKYSEDFSIKAKSRTEAKNKAIDKFRNKKSNFRADVNWVEQ